MDLTSKDNTLSSTLNQSQNTGIIMENNDQTYKRETASIPQKPQAPVVETDNIPTELKTTDRWVLWSFKQADGKWAKVPVVSRGSGFFPINCHSPTNHKSFGNVLVEYQRTMDYTPTEGADLWADGVGFVLSDADNIVGLDCDNCIDEIDEEGEVDMTPSGEAFYEFWETQGAYIEISPSGKGLRAFVRGKLPENMKLKTGVTVEENTCTWEVYDSKRYFTVTGDCMNEVEQLPLVSDEDWANYREYMGTRSLSSNKEYPDLDCTPEPLNELDQQRLHQARKDDPELAKRLDKILIDNGDDSTRDYRMLRSLAKMFPEHPGKVHQIWSDSEAWREKCEDRPDYVERTLLSAYASIPENPFTNLDEEEQQDELKEWGTPEEIHPVSKPAPFPIDALPELMRNAVVEVAERIQAPTEMVVAHAFLVLSTAVQGKYDVVRGVDSTNYLLKSPASLFLLSILESGERKTSASKFKSVLYSHQRYSEDSKAEELDRYKADLDIYEQKKKSIKSKINSCIKKDEDASKYEDELRELWVPEKPMVPTWIYVDMTIEGVINGLKDFPIAALETDEAGLFFGGYSMSSDQSSKSFGQMNRFWDGEPIRVSRGDISKNVDLDNVALSVGLSIQPGIFQKFMDSQGEQAEESGFLARLLISAPESLMGKRTIASVAEFLKSEIAWFGLEDFKSRITKLLNETLAHIYAYPDRIPLVMNEDTLGCWLKYYNSVEIEVKECGNYRDVRATAAKSPENAARIAALFQVLKGFKSANGNDLKHIDFSELAPTEEKPLVFSVDEVSSMKHVAKHIELEQMQSAVIVARWYLDEAQRYQSKVLISQVVRDALNLDSWFRRACRKNSVDRLDKQTVQQFGPSGTRKIERLKEALKLLQDKHRIQIVYEGQNSHKKVWIHLNPALIPNSQDLQ